jgi:hypothetical protein
MVHSGVAGVNHSIEEIYLDGQEKIYLIRVFTGVGGCSWQQKTRRSGLFLVVALSIADGE